MEILTPVYPTGTAAPLRHRKNHDNYPTGRTTRRVPVGIRLLFCVFKSFTNQFGRVMVSTLQTDSKKQAEVDRMASLKSGHCIKWQQHCQLQPLRSPRGTRACELSNTRSGNGHVPSRLQTVATNSLNPADDSVVEVIQETGSPLGRITAERERSYAWRNLLNVCSGRGFDSRRVHHFLPHNVEVARESGEKRS